MHPTLLFCNWICAVVLVQKIPPAWLFPMLALAAALAGAPARRQWGRLLYRSRWLLLVLGATFALMTPGESVAEGLPATWEGLALAAEHLARLLAVLLAVAWLVGGRSPSELLAGLWGLSSLLGSARIRQAVLRLALTLRYAVEASGRRGNWRTLLEGGLATLPADGINVLAFDETPFGWRNALAAGLVCMMTAALWWSLS